MKKAIVTIVSIFIAIPICLLGIFYGLLSYRYQETFMPGVYVNDVYATQLSPEQMNEKLVSMVDPGEFTVKLRGDTQVSFPLSEAGYSYTYLDDLQTLSQKETALKLAERILYQQTMFCEHHYDPKGALDEQTLYSYLDRYEELDDRKVGSNPKVEIVKGKNGYELIDEMQDLLDGQKAREVIAQAIRAGEHVVDLDEADCYVKKPYTPLMERTIALFKEVDALQKCDIKMMFSREVTVDPSITSNWIKLDENGEFYRDKDDKLVLDESLVKEYVEKLAAEFDTIYQPRSFRATSGRVVTIKNSNYGNQIDQKAEVDYLMEAVPASYRGHHEPSYKIRAFSTKADDIGDTYIEVDMTAQKLYYYLHGKLTIQADVVTGNTRLGRGTPEKLCYVYFKQRNRVLRGPDYATPVKYWIAVNGHIGIHDANWRNKFGGEIYKTNGSHGCINTPTKEVSELYDLVEIGTPVLIFY